MNKHEKHWLELLLLIKEHGFDAHCMSSDHSSGSLKSCAVVLGGYVITEDGFIFPPDCVIRQIYD
jgi:hypothetical protein